MPPFAQSRCQPQISILEIFPIFLRLIPPLAGSPSLTLAKIEHFSNLSLGSRLRLDEF